MQTSGNSQFEVSVKAEKDTKTKNISKQNVRVKIVELLMRKCGVFLEYSDTHPQCCQGLRKLPLTLKYSTH